MRRGRLLVAVLCALWLGLTGAVALDEAAIGGAERAIAQLRTDLTRITQELRNPALNDIQLTEYRSALDGIRADAIARSQLLQGPMAEVEQQLASLGQLEDGKEEPAAIATQRSELTTWRDRLRSAKSGLDVLAIEAEQMVGRVTTQQRDNFFRRIFRAERSILDPGLWADTAAGLGTLWTRLSTLFTGWWGEVATAAKPWGLLVIPLLAAAAVVAYRRGAAWVGRWFGTSNFRSRTPDDITRLWRVVWGQIKSIIVAFAIILAANLAIAASGMMTTRFDMIFDAVASIVSGAVLYYLLAYRVFAPGQPAWRLVDVSDGAAARLPPLVGLAGLFAVGTDSLAELYNGLFMPLTSTIGQAAFSALVMLTLVAVMLWTLRNQGGLDAKTPGRSYYFNWSSVFAGPAWLMIAVGFAALLLGYLSLANFLAQQLFQTAVLIVTLFLLHHLSDAAVAASFDPQSGFGRFFRRATGFGERAIERLGLLFRTAVDVLLVVIGVPLLLVLWAVTWVDLQSIYSSAMLGVRIGEVTVSPGVILLVLAILVGGVLLTNFIIGWLDRRILSETRIDKGVQDSLRKGASYTGYTVAAAFALSAAGLDFSNIAIIAGALGVGIGFGLQSIVNNFISGLILLAERPIRVGDWVVLDSGEGLVKRINVRSTEIETFDSCSIIVPNLSLITGVVRNWTHLDTIGRFLVPVTVEYGTDPKLVHDILVEAARAHGKVLTYPEPGVTLAKFGTAGLEFELRGTVANVFDAGAVASDLRYAILERFGEKGITIPRSVAVFEATKK